MQRTNLLEISGVLLLDSGIKEGNLSETLGLKLKSDWELFISLDLSNAATDGGGMDGGAAAVTSSKAGVMMPLLCSPNKTALLASFGLFDIKSEGDFNSG